MERYLQPTRLHLMKPKGQYVLPIRVVIYELQPWLGLERILESIRGRVLQWTQLNTARSLLMQDDIRNGLDEYDRKIDTCIATYNVHLSLIDLHVITHGFASLFVD